MFRSMMKRCEHIAAVLTRGHADVFALIEPAVADVSWNSHVNIRKASQSAPGKSFPWRPASFGASDRFRQPQSRATSRVREPDALTEA